KAAEMLLRPFYVEGRVVHGKALGRTLGFPTANIKHDLITPGRGVYAGWAERQGQFYPAVVNIGTRPTVDTHGEETVECHILDFSDDLYGEDLKFHFIEKIRNEKKFSGKIELEEQISKDIASARSLLKGKEIR
ncbi:MAG: riboflavin kinase, partial [Bdellovibrionales bacterium]|nr:riboflavin kinase [Bdellovibrionales bacterium]